MATAQASDLDAYINLLETVAVWLHSRELSPLPKKIYRDSKVFYADSIARGEVYLAYLKNSLAGALRLVPNDGIVWPTVCADNALYLENLLVSRAWSPRSRSRDVDMGGAPGRNAGEDSSPVGLLCGEHLLEALLRKAGLRRNGASERALPIRNPSPSAI